MGEAWDKRRNHDLLTIAKAIESTGEIGATRPGIVGMTGLSDSEVRAGIHSLRKREYVNSTGQCHHELAFYTLSVPVSVVESELNGGAGASMDAMPLAEATGCVPVPFGVHQGAKMRVENPEAEVKQILNRGYTTAHECAFVRGLGTWTANASQVGGMTRSELLRKYIVAADKRKVWGNVSKHVVIEAAREALSELRGPA